MPERHPTREVLASPGFRVFLVARFCRATAGTLLGATLSWHVFSVRGSALDLGLLGIVEFLPVIPAGLMAGAVADAFDRLRVLRIARGGVALASAGLLATQTW